MLPIKISDLDSPDEKSLSALDRVNVRRLCFYIEKRLFQTARKCKYITQFKSEAVNLMKALQARKAFNSFTIEHLIAYDKDHIIISFQPTIKAPYIHIDFTIRNENATDSNQ